MAESNSDRESSSSLSDAGEKAVRLITRTTDKTGKVSYQFLYEDGLEILSATPGDILQFVSQKDLEKFEHHAFANDYNKETVYDFVNQMGGPSGGTTDSLRKQQEKLMKLARDPKTTEKVFKAAWDDLHDYDSARGKGSPKVSRSASNATGRISKNNSGKDTRDLQQQKDTPLGNRSIKKETTPVTKTQSQRRRKGKGRPRLTEKPKYEIEYISNHRFTADNQIEYRVKWKGYDKTSSTWEPIESFHLCPEAPEEYMSSLEQEGRPIISPENRAVPAPAPAPTPAPVHTPAAAVKKEADGKTLWHISKIINHRVTGQEHEYQVQWKGYRATTWEPLSSFKVYGTEAIKEYWKTLKDEEVEQLAGALEED